MDDTFYSIRTAVTAQIKVEGSRFIADAIPVTSEQEAKKHLERIKKKYFDATHHCYAYVIGAERTIVRRSDDGEPSGTAGIRIQSAILSHHLSDTLVIVTRYFGGTKLGVGGLGKAYHEAAARGIHSAEIISKALMNVVEVEFRFDDTNAVMNVIHTNKFKITDSRYTDEKSVLHVLVPPAQYKNFHSLLIETTRAHAVVVIDGQQTVIL